MSGIMIKLKTLIRKFRGDQYGAGAIEFAFIAPVLLVLYMGALETSLALALNKRVARASSTIADIITQSEKTDPITLGYMDLVAKAMLGAEAAKNGIKLKITGIKIDKNGNATVAWSWQQDKTKAYNVGSTQQIPTELRTPDSFLVRTELSTVHKLLLFLPGNAGSNLREINMSKTYYLRPRTGDSVTCELCPK